MEKYCIHNEDHTKNLSYDSKSAVGCLDTYRNGNRGRTLISNSPKELPIVHNRIKARYKIIHEKRHMHKN